MSIDGRETRADSTNQWFSHDSRLTSYTHYHPAIPYPLLNRCWTLVALLIISLVCLSLSLSLTLTLALPLSLALALALSLGGTSGTTGSTSGSTSGGSGTASGSGTSSVNSGTTSGSGSSSSGGISLGHVGVLGPVGRLHARVRRCRGEGGTGGYGTD